MREWDYWTVSFIIGMFFLQSIIEDCSNYAEDSTGQNQ